MSTDTTLSAITTPGTDTATTSGKDVGRTTTAPARLLRVAVGVSVTAGLLHYAVVPEHRVEWWVAALFFTLLGAFEIVWAALAWFDNRRPVLWLGILVNAATLAVWAVSRTTGLPFGPEAGEPEAVGAIDVICSVAELVVLITLLLALRSRRTSSTTA